MSHITTHLLDLAEGRPAAGVQVLLEDGTGHELARGTTDQDGRVAELGPRRLASGLYRLRFATANYLAQRRGSAAFFPEVTLAFEVSAEEKHYHVPLLLSDFGYSTYRGS